MSAAKDTINRLLSSNAQWAQAVEQANPNFFTESAKGQSPHTLWIGCSDSRVPDSAVTGTKPGELFVHRNVANQVHLDDKNLLAILDYAVNFLGVEHVIVVGHTECGGAAACLGAVQTAGFKLEDQFATIPSVPVEAPLNRWLEPLTRFVNTLGVSATPSKEALPLVVEENVKQQVENLCKAQTIVDAWAKGTPKGQNVRVHGWVYEIARGRLRDLGISRGPSS